jgi:hypothetical protein
MSVILSVGSFEVKYTWPKFVIGKSQIRGLPSLKVDQLYTSRAVDFSEILEPRDLRILDSEFSREDLR